MFNDLGPGPLFYDPYMLFEYIVPYNIQGVYGTQTLFVQGAHGFLQMHSGNFQCSWKCSEAIQALRRWTRSLSSGVRVLNASVCHWQMCVCVCVICAHAHTAYPLHINQKCCQGRREDWWSNLLLWTLRCKHTHIYTHWLMHTQRRADRKDK